MTPGENPPKNIFPFLSRKTFCGKVFFRGKSFFHGEFFFAENPFSGTRDPARPARSGPGRSGQVRPGRSGRLRTAQVSDFPIISSAARTQPRPAGGRPRLPPAEPGCGVTPNQNDPGTGRGGFATPKGHGLNAPSPANTGVVGRRERPLVAGRSDPTPLLASWDGEVKKSMQNHHFPPHPWHSRNPGMQNLQTAPDRFSL